MCNRHLPTGLPALMPGNGRYFFAKKSIQKLSAAPFAMKGSAYTFFITAAKVKAELNVHFGLCFYVLVSLFVFIFLFSFCQAERSRSLFLFNH